MSDFMKSLQFGYLKNKERDHFFISDDDDDDDNDDFNFKVLHFSFTHCHFVSLKMFSFFVFPLIFIYFGIYNLI